MNANHESIVHTENQAQPSNKIKASVGSQTNFHSRINIGFSLGFNLAALLYLCFTCWFMWAISGSWVWALSTPLCLPALVVWVLSAAYFLVHWIPYRLHTTKR